MELKIDKSEWQKVKLIQVVTKLEENDRENAKNRFDRFLKVEHMDAESLHIKRWATQEEEDINPTFYKIFRKGQILFPTRNPHLRRTALASFDGICGEKTLTLQPNEEFVIPEFIPFLFHSERFYAHTTGAIIGSTNPHCRWRDVANYEFLLPPKDQQAQLAELLWAMDEVVEKEMEVLEKTYVVTKSLYKRFQNGSKGWTKYKIGDLLQFNYGKPLKEQDRINGGFPVVTSAGIQGTHNSYLTIGPGIVVGRKGNVGQVTWLNNNFWTTDTAYYISVKEAHSNIPIKFFYYLLISTNLEKLSIATAVPGLNRDDALMTRIYLPNEEAIYSYLNKFNALDDQIEQVISKISSSKALQKSLINQIF